MEKLVILTNSDGNVVAQNGCQSSIIAGICCHQRRSAVAFVHQLSTYFPITSDSQKNRPFLSTPTVPTTILTTIITFIYWMGLKATEVAMTIDMSSLSLSLFCLFFTCCSGSGCRPSPCICWWRSGCLWRSNHSLHRTTRRQMDADIETTRRYRSIAVRF